MAEPLSLGQLGRVLLRYWILIVVGTLLGAVLAFGATRLMTPVYRATATQLVKGQPGTGSAPSYEAAQYAISRAKTYPSFVYNEGVLKAVREDLGNIRTIEQVRGDLTASNPVATPLLEITAAGTTPQEAADKANSAAKHLALFITRIESVNGKSPISVELAVQAALPTEAATPKTLVITALGAMIGFGLATIVALLNSFIRYQRRSAFRRRQAMSWASGESGTAAKAAEGARPAPVAVREATAVTAATAVEKVPPAPEVVERPSVETRPVEHEPVQAAPEPVGAAVPEDQPALVGEHELETVSTVVLTKISSDDLDPAAAEVEVTEPESFEDDDLYPTIRIADLEGFLGLSDPDRRVLVDFALDADRPVPNDGAVGRNGSGRGDAEVDADRPAVDDDVAGRDGSGPDDAELDDDRPMADAVAAEVDSTGTAEDAGAADGPVIDEPVADEPAVDEPVFDEPAVDDAVAAAGHPGPVDESRPDADPEADDPGSDEDATLVRPVEAVLADGAGVEAPSPEGRPAPNGVSANGHANGQSMAKEPVPR